MKDKANFLVKFLDDENEMKQEYIYGADNDSKSKSKFANRDNNEEEEDSKTKNCLQNIIIDP